MKRAKLTLAMFALGLMCSTTQAEEALNAKTKPKDVDPSGTWRWEYDWNENHVKEAFRLNLEADGKVSGTLQRNDNELTIKNGKIKGDQLSFSVSAEYNGTEWVADYVGKIKEDAFDGTVTVSGNGNSRDFPFNPKRSVKIEDVMGLWQLRIENPNGGTFEPTLQIRKTGDGFQYSYRTSSDIELDVDKLEIKKNNLVFRVSAESDGVKFIGDFKGRPYGDTLKGVLEYDYSGEIGETDFQAKRIPEKKNAP